ncbi:hypothetical protein L207DRAFT_611640 [Hyaloscypha variabilis F]|uniref:F-box domain-containing protein n=1 Tax=Hyaloscypha variabilis (strain UAMH 11265 / GT02V1 / F) TaxID=1149755 RepID=A0A2J6QXH5_HYAVF|nr:hypothetical protein L207DRAFT_611640 [Hyaloscypha variabilis F]
MASASSNPSAQGEVGDLDFLTSLPPEILLNIVSRLPSKFFLDLVHTSKHLRNFMKLNANLICNEAIRSRFHLQSALLHSETASGWLVPTHQKLIDDEKRYKGNIRTINNHWALFGEPLFDSTPGIKVTAPGPQYLHFLEQGVLQIMSEAEMRVYRYLQARGTRLPPQVPAEPFFEEVVDGKRYFYKLKVTSEWGGQVVEEKFFTFLETCNMALPTGRRWFRELDFLGQNPKPDRLLRELVWFYGIEEVKFLQGLAELWMQRHTIPSQPPQDAPSYTQHHIAEMASQHSSSTASSNMGLDSKDVDYLTNLPPEVLLKIIALIPSKFYLDIIHTSKFLRSFLKLNASQICNEAIRTRYALEAKVLETTMEAGWLVPTSRKLKEEETRYTLDFRRLHYVGSRYRYITFLCEKEQKRYLRTSMMEPGQQYIYFLEQDLLHVWSEKELKMLQPQALKDHQDRRLFFEVTVDGKVHIVSILGQRLELLEHHEVRQKFRNFVKSLGRQFLSVDPIPPNTKSAYFPRELTWFYEIRTKCCNFR